MENKVVDNREEQRIEREAKEKYPESMGYGQEFYDGNYFIKQKAYIAGATKEAARNKEDAIGFADFAAKYYVPTLTGEWYSKYYSGKMLTTEQLYEIYINQKV